jgi:hypothetical protein
MIVDKHQGIEISFNQSMGKFTAPNDLVAISIPAMKKQIDKFLANNRTIDPPIKIHRINSRDKIMEVVTITTRGLFSTKEGSIINSYNDGDWIVYDPENEKLFKRLDDLNKEIQEIEMLRNKKYIEQRTIQRELHRRTLSTIRQELRIKG